MDIIKANNYKTDTPGAYFSKDSAQPLDTVFFCGGDTSQAAIVIAGIRGISGIKFEQTPESVDRGLKGFYCFFIYCENLPAPIRYCYETRAIAESDRYTLLIMIDKYWLNRFSNCSSAQL